MAKVVTVVAGQSTQVTVSCTGCRAAHPVKCRQTSRSEQQGCAGLPLGMYLGDLRVRGDTSAEAARRQHYDVLVLGGLNVR